MGLEFPSLNDCGLPAAAEVFARGFSDYLVRIEASTGMLRRLARTESVDFALSRLVKRDGDAVGAALVAHRGSKARLAGMALVPEARRQGIGRATMTRLVDEARARGDRSMVLEVIEQNPPAVRLYESCGFTRVRRLVGFRRSQQAEDIALRPVAQLEEVDLRALVSVVRAHGFSDLPWQLSADTLAELPPSTVCYSLAGAWIAVTTAENGTAGVRALVTEQPFQGKGRGATLLRATLAKHPGKEWTMSPIWPDELAAVFLEAGFARTSLSQWQMARDFA